MLGIIDSQNGAGVIQSLYAECLRRLMLIPSKESSNTDEITKAFDSARMRFKYYSEIEDLVQQAQMFCEIDTEGIININKIQAMPMFCSHLSPVPITSDNYKQVISTFMVQLLNNFGTVIVVGVPEEEVDNFTILDGDRVVQTYSSNKKELDEFFNNGVETFKKLRKGQRRGSNNEVGGIEPPVYRVRPITRAMFDNGTVMDRTSAIDVTDFGLESST
jgi:hypothetical protein